MVRRLLGVCHAPVDHLDVAVGSGGELRIVRDDDDRSPILSGQGEKQLLDEPPRDGVQISGRFIGEYHPGIVRERAGDRDALTLPSGELMRQLMGMTTELQTFEQLHGPFPRVRRRKFAEPSHRQQDVVEAAELWKKKMELKDETQRREPATGEIVLGHGRCIDTVQQHPAG